MYCCARADGHPLDEGEWDIKDNHYRVFVTGEWAVVPDDTVILAPNKFGKAIVWLVNQGEVETVLPPLSTRILCFMPGSGGLTKPRRRDEARPDCGQRGEAAGANKRATSRQPFVFSLERLLATPAPSATAA